MSTEDETLMAKYNITSESKLTYSYKQHRYGQLKDAVKFAMHESELAQEESNLGATEQK